MPLAEASSQVIPRLCIVPFPWWAQILGYKEAFKVNWEKINPAAVANASQADFYWALSLACSRLFDASKPSQSEVAFYVDPFGTRRGTCSRQGRRRRRRP